ncbi:MAG: type II secretion system protein GspL [Pseudomonas sp.]|uniref:type II secretion system protein GspL n=1 Tax=Pseudomonas sp. TaxID=306 RepID=UPI0033995B75
MDCLFLPPTGGAEFDARTRFYWLPSEGDGAWLALEDCVEASQDRPLSLVVPAEACSAFAVSLPTQKERWLRQALPFAVEELLAEDVEQTHLALGERMADGRYRVIALRRSLLSAWLKQLQAAGLTVLTIYLDADLLPREHSQLLLLEDRALLGGADEARLAFAADAWPSVLGHFPGALQVHGQAPQAPTGIDDYQCLEDPYRWLAQGRAKAVNLAQGDFAVKAPSSGAGPWKPLLAVAGLWALLQLGFNLGQSWYLERQADAYAAASRALYQELFPQDTRIVNLRAQFAEHLAQGNGGGVGGFLPLLNQTSSVLGGEPGLSVEQLDYSQTRGDLALQVRAADFAALEQLRQRLSDAGMAVQLGSANREENGVTARVVIGG